MSDQRGLTIVLVVVLLLLNIFVGLMIWGAFVQSKKAAALRSYEQASNLALLLAGQVDNTFEKTQIALLAAKDEVEGALREGRSPGKVLPALLARQQSRIQEVSILSFADANGEVQYQAGKVLSGRPNVAGRDYFIQLRKRSSAGFGYSAPFRGHLSGNWANVIAVRVNRPDGTLYGVLFAAIYSKKFEDLFARLNIQDGGTASLRYQDLSLAARYPSHANSILKMGERQVSPQFLLQKNVNPDHGYFFGSIVPEDAPRILAYHRTLFYPGYAIVGISEKLRLADRRHEYWSDLVLGGLFLCLTVLVGYLVDRSWRRLRRISFALGEEKQHFHIVADYVHDWEYWIDPEGKLLYVSPSCERTTGYTAAEMIDDPELIPRLVHPEDRERWQALIHQESLMECEPIDFRIIRKDGQVRWLSRGSRAVYGKDGSFLGRRVNQRDVTVRVHALEQLHELVRTDALTGLFNRRSFSEVVLEEFERSRRYSSTASILFIDLDRFKAINDKFGHAAGDEALAMLAKLLKEMIRASDTAARWGGEEFLLLLPNTSLSGAREFAERVRVAAYNLVISTAHGDVHFTISIGCAEFHSSDQAWTDALSRADDALYHAKKKGRNRVILASLPENLPQD